MTLHRKVSLGSTGKLLKFPMAPRSAELQSQTLRRAKSDRWQLRFWLLLAWLVAIDRLRIAVARLEVFDLQDALAFMVAAVMPFLSARRIAAMLGEVQAALSAGFVARRSRSRARNADSVGGKRA